jgi:serine/threonine protein kinase
MSREVAIKRLRARFCDDPALVRRFRFEALLTGRLSHPGIVPVYATSPPDEPQPYFINQLVDGVTMERAIGQLHGAGAREVLGVQHRDEFLKLLRHFIAMCETVAYTHNRGVIHRDLKPRNVLLGSFGETFVIDWGLARPVEDMESWVPMERGHRLALREDALPGATSPDAILGTTQYSSPERVSGAAPRGGPVCDVYSLGATFYHLLTGRPPFDPELKLDALIERITQGQFARPREVVPSIPPPLEEICLQAMALRKSDRYAKAALLVRDLESWLDETTASALRPALPGRVMGWLWRQRRPPAGRPAGRGAGVPGDQRPERPHRRRRES